MKHSWPGCRGFSSLCAECTEKLAAEVAARLTSERDAALAEVAALKSLAVALDRSVTSYRAALDQARSALSEALAALRRYGTHDGQQGAMLVQRCWAGPTEVGIADCTCGLDTALRKGEGRDG